MIELPSFPATGSPKLYETIQATLKRSVGCDNVDCNKYLSSFAKHRAHATLWQKEAIPIELTGLSLLIAQHTTQPIPLDTLVDLSIVCADSNLARLQQIFNAQLTSDDVATHVLPTFIRLLETSSQAFDTKSKIAQSIHSFLRACSPFPHHILPFALSKPFILALASLYHTGLTSFANSHGIFLNDDQDDWTILWVKTKVALIDSFHILFTALLDIAPSHSEYIFDIIFALLDLRSTSTSPPTPFLNLPLIADYQHAYDLSDKLSAVFVSTTERDPRLDLLESSLTLTLSGVQKKNPGALRILLPSIGTNQKSPSPPLPPYAANSANQESSSSIQDKTTQILSILPHLPPSHVIRLLQDGRFQGNVERILEGLLDGSLASEEMPEEISDDHPSTSAKGKQRAEPRDEVSERRNIFNDDDLDAARIRIGKQSIESDFNQDRSATDRMKWDILRRVEEMEAAELESEAEEQQYEKKPKAMREDVDDQDEIIVDSMARVRLVRDEDDFDDDEDKADEADNEPTNIEGIIEQAYLHDPTVFERNAATRRGKPRNDLRNLTGWSDEQIEGWKIMLERTPGKKAKLEEKYSFSGNVKGLEIPHSRSRPGQARGTGRGSGRGRGSDGGGSGNNENSRGSRGSRRGGRGRGHDRKKGHDKKVARAGGVA